jgi:aldose 1-epimerase
VRVEGERAVEIRFDDAWSWVQAYTGDALAEGARETLAIEPMTAPPDAFNSGTDLIALDAGASWSGSFRISRAPTSAR